MKLIMAIALGGALGAVGRHLLTHQAANWFGATFPYGTLTVNVLGSFAMGLLVESLAQVWSPPLELRAFLTVGLLGAFTTFSAFSLEIALLLERGALVLAALYVAASVSLCVVGLFFGLWCVRSVLA